MGDKRPRINAVLYREFQKLAIDNDTTAEIEIDKALKWYKEEFLDNDKGGNGTCADAISSAHRKD